MANVFVLASETLKSDSYALVVDPSNNEFLKMYKASFDSVVVTKVVITANLAKLDNFVVRFGLFRSLAAAPTDKFGVTRIPYLHTLTTDTRTAKSHTIVCTPGAAAGDENRTSIMVPGLEWDLKQTAIRAGHPHVILAAETIGSSSTSNAAVAIGSLQIEYHVTLGGTGPGY